jgi:hypothetical protein
MAEPRAVRPSLRRRLLGLGVAVALPAFVATLLGQSALAQTRPVGRGHPPARGVHKGAADAGPTVFGAAPGLTATPGPAPTAGATISGDAGAGVVESRTLDGGTKVFKFSELDIEGRLRSPQLVYFLRRVRAEFSAGDLGHRTFMREMSETRKEPSFE